jgi:hypothetical protein
LLICVTGCSTSGSRHAGSYVAAHSGAPGEDALGGSSRASGFNSGTLDYQKILSDPGPF